jgi:outer membrane autotransporter protein
VAPGYTAKSGGATIGFDVLANDDMMLGVAYTMADTKLKHKNFKSGDTTRAKTSMFSVYGLQQLPMNFFVQAIASFGTTEVTNKEIRIYRAGNQTATAKYDSTAYTMEATGGYNLEANKYTMITPMVGVRYARFSDSGYSEKGTSLTNYTVGKKSTNKVDAIIGARVNFIGQTDSGITWRPEMHAFVNQSLSNKAPKVDARLDGQKSSSVSQPNKPAKTFVNVGTSLGVNYSMMEYGIGYDAYFGKKYVSHQGTLKVRVNF